MNKVDTAAMIAARIGVHENQFHTAKKAKGMVSPTLEETRAFFLEEKIDVDPGWWWRKQEAKEWRISDINKMRNWKQAARNSRDWDNAPKNPNLERSDKTRLCGCGCGRSWNIDVGSEVFYNSECRKKVLGW